MKKLTIVLLTSLIAFACGQGQKGEIIRIDGSSTVFPITEAVAEEFQKKHRGYRVTVGVSGTGGGFQKFCNNETDISDASRPIQPTEVKKCGEKDIQYIELPVAFDGIAVVVHPENDWVDSLTIQDLRKMWRPKAENTATKWSDIRPEWPDKPLDLYGPGVDSGTFDYFTEVITGEAGKSRGDFTMSEDDNVLVQGVTRNKNALGFFGLAYYEENQDKLRLVPITDGNPNNGKGPIAPSLETVKNGTYQPLSRPLFIYVRKKATERKEINKFIKFYLNKGGPLAKEVGYIPFPDKVYQLALKRYEKRVTGSMFKEGKQEAGTGIEELLKKNM